MARNTKLEYPNRDKASSKLMRLLVIVALLVSSALILIVSIRGWDLMQGGKILNLLFVALNIVFVIQLLRWSRGVLPMSAGLAAFVGIFSGVSIQSWYERDAPGYTDAQLSADLGFLTILIFAVQLVVIVLAITAFTQNWQIEVERRQRDDDAGGDTDRRRGDAVPA
jgi:hypothetical protein